MDWESLHFFQTFLRAGSLTAAAKLLGVEHATVVRRIASLESQLNLKLIDRRGRSYELTDDGRKVAEFAEEMANSSYALQRFASGENDQIHGRVTVSAPPAFIATLIAGQLGSLLELHSNLTINLVGDKSSSSLSRMETDLAIRFIKPTEASAVVRLLGMVKFPLYASPEYLTKKEPAQFKFIGYDYSLEDTAQQIWLQGILNGRDIVIRSNDVRVQAQAAVGGAGVAMLPSYVGIAYDLVPISEEADILELPLWIAYHQDLKNSARVRVVKDFLLKCLAPTLM